MGVNGSLFRWDGESWRRQLLPFSDTLNGLAGRWLAGDNGLFDLEAAEAVNPLNGESAHLLDVDAVGWGVGRDGVILYGDGQYWSMIPKITADDVYAVDFPIPQDGWGVGENGVLLHYSLNPPPLSPVVSTPIEIDDPTALLKNWGCAILLGETFYEVKFFLEPPADSGQILASMLIPFLENTLIALEGEFVISPSEVDPAWLQFENSEDVLAWLTLRETELLHDGTNGGYVPNGVFRLMLHQDGRVSGGVFVEDSSVGEIPACEEIR
jgi:hypothetical protein